MISIVVCPHPDDAALSIGCYLLHLSGKRYIITIFNKSMSDDMQTEQTLLRANEEINFTDFITAKLDMLHFKDTNYKNISWKYYDYTLKKEEMKKIVCSLSDKLNAIKEEYDLYIPLAIGLHPDHVMCYYSCLQAINHIIRRPKSVFFYEDVPYCTPGCNVLVSNYKIIQLGRDYIHHYGREEKIRLLKFYSSQLTINYVFEILNKFPSEKMICVNPDDLIGEKLCIVEYLAQIDGIKLT